MFSLHFVVKSKRKIWPSCWKRFHLSPLMLFRKCGHTSGNLLAKYRFSHAVISFIHFENYLRTQTFEKCKQCRFHKENCLANIQRVQSGENLLHLCGTYSSAGPNQNKETLCWHARTWQQWCSKWNQDGIRSVLASIVFVFFGLGAAEEFYTVLNVVTSQINAWTHS